jgi:hypothetical protein
MWNPVCSGKAKHSARFIMYATNTAKAALSCAHTDNWFHPHDKAPAHWVLPDKHRTYYWNGTDRRFLTRKGRRLQNIKDVHENVIALKDILHEFHKCFQQRQHFQAAVYSCSRELPLSWPLQFRCTYDKLLAIKSPRELYRHASYYTHNLWWYSTTVHF